VADQSFVDVAAVAPGDVWVTGTRLVFHDPNTPPPAPVRSTQIASRYEAAAAHGTAPSPRALTDALSLGAVEHAVIWHFDGDGWSVVPHPAMRNPWTNLNGIDGRSSDDIWAVGTAHVVPLGGMDIESGRRTLIEHFDGRSWERVFSPSPGSRRNSLYGVAE